MGVRPESKSRIEKKSKFGTEKFRISFAHQVQTSKSLSIGRHGRPPPNPCILGTRFITTKSVSPRKTLFFTRSQPSLQQLPDRRRTIRHSVLKPELVDVSEFVSGQQDLQALGSLGLLRAHRPPPVFELPSASYRIGNQCSAILRQRSLSRWPRERTAWWRDSSAFLRNSSARLIGMISKRGFRCLIRIKVVEILQAVSCVGIGRG
jgi:hypothetical protein